jgi:hypothetical protein
MLDKEGLVTTAMLPFGRLRINWLSMTKHNA